MERATMDPDAKRGYLNTDFQLFHIKDQNRQEFDFHYHDFSKIILFISGNVTYMIEGKAYHLKPWDLLLVGSHEIHRPSIDPSAVYERIVIWLRPAFLEKYMAEGCNLLTCFETVRLHKSNLLRLGPEIPRHIKYILSELETASQSSEFGSHILKESLFMQLMVHVNRLTMNSQRIPVTVDIEYDPQIEAILEFINGNLGDDLSIQRLSSHFYMNKYYLMHKFKLLTGHSIHNYILQKRLIWANELIREGKSITQASLECGFSDYSSFVRAFKKMYDVSPRKYYKKRL